MTILFDPDVFFSSPYTAGLWLWKDNGWQVVLSYTELLQPSAPRKAFQDGENASLCQSLDLTNQPSGFLSMGPPPPPRRVLRIQGGARMPWIQQHPISLDGILGWWSHAGGIIPRVGKLEIELLWRTEGSFGGACVHG